MISLTLHIDSPAAEATRRLVALGRARPTDFAEGAAIEVSGLVREHLERESVTRHDTADRLGARRTGHLEDAAQSVAHTVDDDGASVSISSPGIRRAAGSYEIRPRQARALTIPVHRLAYGHRVAELRARGIEIFRPVAPGGRRGSGPHRDYLATVGSDGRLEVLYLLRQSVTIPQDRTLLPSDDALSDAATRGARAVMQALIGAPA